MIMTYINTIFIVHSSKQNSKAFQALLHRYDYLLVYIVQLSQFKHNKKNKGKLVKIKFYNYTFQSKEQTELHGSISQSQSLDFISIHSTLISFQKH